MEKGVVKYHLDLLKDVGFAAVTSGNYVTGHVYWSLTPAGRKHAVEKKLI
jgi:DNA-binding HxlR family transcriptional regulator